MIASKDILFIHVPKTGGSALTECLLGLLPGPVYYARPLPTSKTYGEGVVLVEGVRHETLAEAAAVMARCGLELQRCPLVIAALRNPYALAVSRFSYLRKGHPWDKGRNQELALAGDFTSFAMGCSNHAGDDRPIESFFTLGEVMPPNLQVLRFETLEEDFNAALARIGLPAQRLPRVNVSQHAPYQTYYTREAEAAVYRRYRWVFDKGFYPRMDKGALG